MGDVKETGGVPDETEPHSFLIKNTCSVCAATKPELSVGVRKYLEWLARGLQSDIGCPSLAA